MNRTNFVFGLAAALLLLHVSPVNVYMDHYSVIVIGMMFAFCLAEHVKFRKLDAEVGPTGAKLSMTAREKKNVQNP